MEKPEKAWRKVKGDYIGRCKKFGEAGVQAKSGSANVDVEVEVKFWFHCAIVSSPVRRKRRGKVSKSRPSPGESSVLATACRALARCESLL